MNQILSMNNDDRLNNGNFFGNNNGPSNREPLETKTTVLIFSIVLIVFGLIMVIMGGVKLANHESVEIADDWPKFEIEKMENQLAITVSHDKIINEIKYKWNNGFETKIPGTGEKNKRVEIQIPTGDNVLYFTSIDVNGKESVYQETFTGTVVTDTVKPIIEINRIGSKVNIVAKTTTDTNLAYITYQWGTDQETRVNATDDKTMIQTQTPAPVGKNDITVTAVKENGVREVVTRQVLGLIKPKIDVQKQDKKLKITISHESGIQSADIVFNGKNQVLASDYFGADKKTVELSLKLVSGKENTIKIDATSMDGSSDTYSGVYEG